MWILRCFSLVCCFCFARDCSAQSRCSGPMCTPFASPGAIVPASSVKAVKKETSTSSKAPKVKPYLVQSKPPKEERIPKSKNFGIKVDELPKGAGTITIGPGVHRDFVGPIEQVKPLEDDSKKPYIVVVGDEAYQAKAKQALAAIPEVTAFHVGYYEPSQWQTKDVAYPPGVTICGPPNAPGKSRACHYQADLEGLDKPISVEAGALRRPAPDFDRKLVPDLRKKLFPNLDFSWARPMATSVLWTLVFAVGGLIYLKM